MTPSPDEVAARLRVWARLSSAPLTAPPRGPPTAEQLEARLREATALWVAAALLGDLGRSIARAEGRAPW
jgi:hypothetical protein